MKIVDVAAWTWTVKGSKSEAECRDLFERDGFDPDKLHAPIYVDVLPEVPRKWDIKMVPQLQNAINTILPGGRFTVASLRDFAPVKLWKALMIQELLRFTLTVIAA